MDKFKACIQQEGYPIKASVGFYDAVMAAILRRKEVLFIRKILFLWVGTVGMLISSFYFLATACAKLLSADVLEFVDMGMQNPDMLMTSEWQSTIMEGMPTLELLSAVLCMLGFMYIFSKTSHTFFSHSKPYARTLS